MPDVNNRSRSTSGTTKEWIVFCKLRHNSRGPRTLSNSLVGLKIVVRVAFEVFGMHVMQRGQSWYRVRVQIPSMLSALPG